MKISRAIAVWMGDWKPVIIVCADLLASRDFDGGHKAFNHLCYFDNVLEF